MAQFVGFSFRVSVPPPAKQRVGHIEKRNFSKSAKYHISASDVSYSYSYETMRKFKNEPQNIEQEISNDEVWNRFALTILDNFKSIEYLTSIFMIPCSIFDIRFFIVSFTIRPAAL